MTLILLIFAALIVALQIALTLTLKRLLDLLAASREQVDALQRRVLALEQERQAQMPPPSALFTLAPRDDEPPPPTAEAQVVASPAPQAAAAVPLPVLREELNVQQHTQSLGEQVRELARQGMPVRDIAERCGLSEAEAELMIRLRQEPL
jgi:hypothetical protein